MFEHMLVCTVAYLYVLDTHSARYYAAMSGFLRCKGILIVKVFCAYVSGCVFMRVRACF